jgi:hypothetical protein
MALLTPASPGFRLARPGEAVERVRRDMEGTSGVEMTFHTYDHGDAAKHWHFVVAAKDSEVPRRWTHGPLRSLAGAGAGVNVAPEDDTVLVIASIVTEAVQLTRWARGLDPTWPPCPIHGGQHPLRPTFTPDGTRWLCPSSSDQPSGGWPLVGDLTPAFAAWGIASQPGSVNFTDRPS